MMNIKESLKKTQGRGAGFVNGSSAKFAQLLIEEGESVEAAVTANIFTRKGHFPGVVAITDKRVFAACGLPGIHRLQTLPLEELILCGHTESPLTWRFSFYTASRTFRITLSPVVGKNLLPHVENLQRAIDRRRAASA